MQKKMSGTIWPRMMAVAAALMVVLSMSLGVTRASGDDGVIETPAVTAAPTPTAEPTDDSVAEVPEVEDEGEGEEAETKTPKPTSTATAEPTEDPTEEPTKDPTEEPTEEPTKDPTEEPTEEPVPPMEKFVDVTIGECQVTITQKDGVERTEVIADNGSPGHWGITKGNPTLVVKPVDASKDLVVRIIPVISENESWEYSVTLEASASCDEPDPGPKPDPKSGNLVESSLVCRPEGGGTVTTTTTPWTQDWVLEDGKWVLGEVVSGYPVQDQRDATEQECPVTKPTPTPTPTDPPSGEPTVEPTDPPSGEPTVEPTKAPTTAPSGDPGSDKDKSDPKGPAKTGVTGGNSTDAILAGTALAAIMTSALVAVRMKRRPSGKYAARS